MDMNMTALPNLAQLTVQGSAVRQIGADGGTSGLSFSELLSGLWGDSAGTSTDTGDILSLLGYSDSDTGGVDLYGLLGGNSLSLEAYMALLNGNASAANTVLNTDLVELVSKLKELFGEGGEEISGQQLEELEALLKKARQTLEELMLTSGYQTAFGQLVLMMEQLGNPSASWYSQYAGNDLLGTSSEATTLLTKALQAEPGELLELLTKGSPYEGTLAGEQAAGAVQEDAAAEKQTQSNAQAAANQPVQQEAQPKASSIAWTDPKGLEKVYENTVLQAAGPGGEKRAQGAVGEAELVSKDSGNALNQAESAANLHQVRLGLAKTEGQAAETGQGRTQTGGEAENAAKTGVSAQPEPAVFSVEQPEAEVAEARPVQVPVQEQLHTGIVRGLNQGNNEFTVKLNPEGLGEVVVKLEKAGEMMNLSIIAKNPETKGLLEAQMDVLKENLRPLKVEVDNIFTEKQYDDYIQQQGSSQQEGYQQMKDGWAADREGHGANAWAGSQGAAADAEAQPLAQRVYISPNELNTYV